MSNYLQSAFARICEETTTAEGHYVALMERVPYYGGPEEGGWWGEDVYVVAYQRYDTPEAADTARKAVDKLAKELSEEAHRSHGEHCLRQMDWLEARGLDADYFPEDDGDVTYYITVTKGIPEGSQGVRGYS